MMPTVISQSLNANEINKDLGKIFH